MAVEKGRTDAMLLLGNLYRYKLQDYENAEKYYLMTLKEGQVHSKVLTSGRFFIKKSQKLPGIRHQRRCRKFGSL